MEKPEGTPFIEPLSPSEFALRIKKIESMPGKVIRMDFASTDHTSIDGAIREFNRGKKEFERMEKEYGIAISQTDFVLGRAEGDEDSIVMYSVVDKISGENLDKTEKFPDEAEAEFDNFYANISRYYADVYKNGGTYWGDYRDDQFVYGHKDKETKDRIYCVDVEPYYSDKFTPGDIDGTRRILHRLEYVLSGIQSTEQKFSQSVTFVHARDVLKNALMSFQNDEKYQDLVRGMLRRLKY
ncbi:MAG: hypothetical protein HYW88_00735 [Candidatus Sungbacteria bacterium]|nr:hypothetical protein [Candidatus Sungbacteria bacterium]